MATPNGAASEDEKSKEKHRDVERERRAKLSAYFRQLNELTRKNNLSLSSSSSSTRRKPNQLDVVEMVTNEFQKRVNTNNTATNINNEFLNKNELKQLILESTRESVWLVVHASTGQIVEILDANDDGSRGYLASRSFYELVHPDDFQKVKSKFNSPSFATNQTCACSFVCRLRLKEGLFPDNQISSDIANLTSHNALLLPNETKNYEANQFVTVCLSGYLKVIIMSSYEQNYASQLPTSEFVYFMGTIRPLEIESNSSEPIDEFLTRHDCTGKIIYADKKLAAILGYDTADMIGRNLAEFCAFPEDREFLETQLELVYQTLIARESPVQMVIRLVRPDTSMSVVSCRTRAYAHCNPISKAYEFTDCIHSVIP